MEMQRESRQRGSRAWLDRLFREHAKAEQDFLQNYLVCYQERAFVRFQLKPEHQPERWSMQYFIARNARITQGYRIVSAGQPAEFVLSERRQEHVFGLFLATDMDFRHCQLCGEFRIYTA